MCTYNTPREYVDRDLDNATMIGMIMGLASGSLVIYQPLAFLACLGSPLIGHGIRHLEYKRQDLFGSPKPSVEASISLRLTALSK